MEIFRTPSEKNRQKLINEVKCRFAKDEKMKGINL